MADLSLLRHDDEGFHTLCLTVQVLSELVGLMAGQLTDEQQQNVRAAQINNIMPQADFLALPESAQLAIGEYQSIRIGFVLPPSAS